MKTTTIKCDICGEEIERNPLDLDPKVSVVIEWNPADLVYRSRGNTEIIDLCKEHGDLVRHFIRNQIYELRHGQEDIR